MLVNRWRSAAVSGTDSLMLVDRWRSTAVPGTDPPPARYLLFLPDVLGMKLFSIGPIELMNGTLNDLPQHVINVQIELLLSFHAFMECLSVCL